jgi:hypothetical protein
MACPFVLKRDGAMRTATVVTISVELDRREERGKMHGPARQLELKGRAVQLTASLPEFA